MQTPRCVRDNIPVSLLAKAYAAFVGAHPLPESQDAFAERVRREAASRLGRTCLLELAAQTFFPELRVRINTGLVDAEALGRSETRACDEFVQYYRDHRAGGSGYSLAGARQTRCR